MPGYDCREGQGGSVGPRTIAEHTPGRGPKTRERLAYDMALIGKTVTTGASQAMALLRGTAGGEAGGPWLPAGETDTGGDGPCSMPIPRCCANESAGTP